jgi:hypothetical protein
VPIGDADPTSPSSDYASASSLNGKCKVIDQAFDPRRDLKAHRIIWYALVCKSALTNWMTSRS